MSADRPSPAAGQYDLATLRLAYEYWRDSLDEAMEQARSVVTALGASIATSALILGIFGAFRPQTDDVLLNVLFASAVGYFVGIVVIGLLAPTRYHWVYLVGKTLGVESLTGEEPVEEELEDRVSEPLGERAVRLLESVSEEAWLIERIEQFSRSSLLIQTTLLSRINKSRTLVVLLLTGQVFQLIIVTTLAQFDS